MRYTVPEIGPIEINTIVLDLNGTLSVKGKIDRRVKDLLKQLKDHDVDIVLFTGDQRGTADRLSNSLGIRFVRCKNSQEKEAAMKSFDQNTTAAIGNARIDIGTFQNAKVAVATLQAEGIHTEVLEHVDIVVPSIVDALEFFLDKDTFAATMRL